ncbi:MAG: TIGR04150 pseudo-rSAM protein [Salinivirgaceae bacterium]|nr:TIGR04150 pseudo-rSAM protein [Salinivirgaceae bacterium]
MVEILNKAQWFILEPTVFISIKNNNTLFYNTLNSSILEYSDKQILEIANMLCSEENLYAISLSETQLNDINVRNFINDIRNNFMGDIVPTDISKKKPVQTMPFLEIRNDINGILHEIETGDYTDAESLELLGKDVVSQLNHLDLFITDHSSVTYKKPNILSCAYKQFTMNFLECDSSVKNILNLETIKKIIDDLFISNLSSINILGGNIFEHPEISEILSFLNKTSYYKNYYCNYEDIIALKDECLLHKLANNLNSLTVNICRPINKKVVFGLFKELNNLSGLRKLEFQVMIESEDDVAFFEAIFSETPDINCRYMPFFNGNNRTLFEDGVYLDKEDLIESAYDEYRIFQNMSLNTNYFGKLTINSRGDIYSNVNLDKLGNIINNKFADVIFNEIKSKKAWRKTRSSVQPCKDCTYNILCPPISNYEYTLNKFNSCKIR